jgi:hypothetical protein
MVKEGLDWIGVQAAESGALAGKDVVDRALPSEDGSRLHCLETAVDNWQA